MDKEKHLLKAGRAAPDNYRQQHERQQPRREKEDCITRRRYMPRFVPSTQFNEFPSFDVAILPNTQAGGRFPGSAQRNFALSVFLRDGYNLSLFGSE
jgi:hypothetical protein